MKIETKRLELILLTPSQLEQWTADLRALERELQCSYRATPVEGLFREIICEQAKKAKQDLHYQWHSFWFLVRKSDRAVVGSIDFKDVPTPDGIVEIGYGLGADFEHHGYMTEAVRAFCHWGFQQGVPQIIAETEIENTASQRILMRCGFKEYDHQETIWWRLSRPEIEASRPKDE